jgi:uncharacterized protein YciI
VAIFVVELRYRVERAAREPSHPAHAAYLRELTERGVLLLGGPLVGDNCGLLVYRTADRAELDRVLAEEPYVKAGVVAESLVREWQPGKGSWVATREALADGGRS